MGVTLRDLEYLVDEINRVTGSPMTAYTRSAIDGRLRSNIGNYYLDAAYGGYTLYRVDNAAGSVTTPLGIGHLPKREIYNLLVAFLAGIKTE